VTYNGGTLQSVDSLTGVWQNEAGASPLMIQPTGAAKFFRVKGS